MFWSFDSFFYKLSPSFGTSLRKKCNFALITRKTRFMNTIQLQTKASFIAIFCVAMMGFWGCKTIKVDRPREAYTPLAYTPVPSIINLPVDIDLKRVEKAVNDKFKGLIYEDSKLEDDNLQLKLWKIQDFVFNAKGNQLIYRIPLKIWSKFGWKIEKFGISISDYYEVTGEIALKYKSTLTIGRDWQIKTSTVSDGYDWVTKPSMSIAGISVPVTAIANLALKSCSGLINNQIDKAISQSVNLKKEIEKVWISMQEPMNVNEDYNVWLKITPQELYTAPLSSNQNHIKLNIGAKATIESFLGYQPEKGVPRALPGLNFVLKPEESFVLNFSSDITFVKISEIAQKELVGKVFEQGKRKIKVLSFDVFGSEGKMMFMTEISGSANGKIYFTGTPFYNIDSNTIELNDFDFELNTRNALINSANWLLHGTFTKMIQPYLKFPMSDQIKTMKETVNKQLASYKVADGVLLMGNVNEISITSFGVVPGALKVLGSVNGQLQLNIDDLKFK